MIIGDDLSYASGETHGTSLGSTMPTLFEPAKLGSLQLRNRLIRSATHEGMADEDGAPTRYLTRFYERLAKGGVGLIITGYCAVSSDGKSSFTGMGHLDRDELVEPWSQLVDKVHSHGVPIAMQLAHCGRQTTAAALGTTPIAPSAVFDGSMMSMPRAMSEDDIERVIEAFGQAARRAKSAGFDAIQLHGAHGYLICQFLSPYTNRRKDRWGGSLDNRMRFVREIARRCREHVGDDFPLFIKISATDGMRRGLKLSETTKMAAMMEEAGFDAIEVSCGIGEDGLTTLRGELPLEVLLQWEEIRSAPWLLRLLLRYFGRWWMRPPPWKHAFNLDSTKAIREHTRVPLIAVGGMDDPQTIAEIAASGEADFIGLCRALIANPRFPNRMQAGSSEPSGCKHCNLCIGYMHDHPLRCYRGIRLQQKVLEGGMD